LVALSRRWVDSLPQRPVSGDPLRELRSWVDAQTESRKERPHAVAGITMLVEDLKDDELTELLRQGWDRQLEYLAALVTAARAQGTLTRAPNSSMAAALLLDVLNGSSLRAAAGSTRLSSGHTRTSLHALMKGWM
jgi:AcrR family transcriptional regulator